MSDPHPKPEAKPKTGWLNIAVDYGPLLVFLAVYKFSAPDSDAPLGEVGAVIKGTIAFNDCRCSSAALEVEVRQNLADADAVDCADCRLRGAHHLAAR